MAFSTPFRTRSEIISCKNMDPPNVAVCALDVGYSAVKGYGPGSRFCIPAYVQESPPQSIGEPSNTDIRYYDETGEYAVGGLAMRSLASDDTNDASNTLFARKRYFSTTFRILTRVGLALALGNHEERPIFLQTGLPPAYRKADTPLLREALAGTHRFSLKIGGGVTQEYVFELDATNIGVMDQPIGSVYSATKRNDGSTVACEDGKTYIDKRLLVLDGGFGTLDVFSITNRAVDNTNTFSDLGMRAIFEKTAEDIFAQFGTEVHAHTLQRYLDDGLIPSYDYKSRTSTTESFTGILQRNTEVVCRKALEKIDAAYNYMRDYDYLLVTGGTGAAWMSTIREYYKNMATLSVVSANQNEKIPHVYNNVRGYYIYRALAVLAAAK